MPRPLRVLACALGLAAAVPAAAQPVRTDSAIAPVPGPDTAAPVPDATEARVRGAVLRSLTLPGWGQVYNGDTYKAPFALGLVVGAGAFAYVQQDRYLLYRRAAYYANCLEVPDRPACEGFESRQAAYEEAGGSQSQAANYERTRDSARGNRDIGIVVFLGAYALQSLDAYVGANLSNFDVTEDLSVHVRPGPRESELAVRVRL